MKHIREFEDLMADLADVGSVDKFVALLGLKCFIPDPESLAYFEKDDLYFLQFEEILKTTVYGVRTIDEASEAVFKNIQKGDFTVGSLEIMRKFPELDPVADLLTKSNLISLAGKSKDLQEFVRGVGDMVYQKIDSIVQDIEPCDIEEELGRFGLSTYTCRMFIAPEWVLGSFQPKKKLWGIGIVDEEDAHGFRKDLFSTILGFEREVFFRPNIKSDPEKKWIDFSLLKIQRKRREGN